jgi:hypothetical protein
LAGEVLADLRVIWEAVNAGETIDAVVVTEAHVAVPSIS